MSRKKTPKKEDPGKATVVSFRAPTHLVSDLDSYLKKLRKESPGGNWTRSSAALNLVAKGLKTQCEHCGEPILPTCGCAHD